MARSRTKRSRKSKPHLKSSNIKDIQLSTDLSTSLQIFEEEFSIRINDDVCHVCRDGGDLICCVRCIHAFHLGCTSKTTANMNTWHCLLTGHRCSIRSIPRLTNNSMFGINFGDTHFDDESMCNQSAFKLSVSLKGNKNIKLYRNAKSKFLQFSKDDFVQIMRRSISPELTYFARASEDSDDDEAEADFICEHPPIGQVLYFFTKQNISTVVCRILAYPENTVHGRDDRFVKNELIQTSIEVEVPLSHIARKINVVRDVDDVRDNVWLCRYHYVFAGGRVQPLLAKGRKAWKDNVWFDEIVSGFSHNAKETNLENARKKGGKRRKISSKFSALRRAQTYLELSAAPNKLPCRDEERQKIEDFLIQSLHSNQSGSSLYVCGMPGTGKTATVVRVIHSLKTELADEVPDFDYFEINAMKLQSPAHAYCALWTKIKGQKVSPDKALLCVQQYFSSNARRRKHIILVIDEFDYLIDQKQKVIFNLVDLQTWKNSKFIMIALANTLDLPERMMARVDSRVGMSRVNFKPYSFKQIESIVWARLEAMEEWFDTSAMQLCARKVAGVCGDLRRALRICSNAVELCLQDDQSEKVTIRHVNEAVKSFDQSTHIQLIEKAALDEQMFLIALALELNHAGTHDVKENAVCRRYTTLCRHRGRSAASYSDIKQIAQQLHDVRLLSLSRSRGEPVRNVSLNLLQDDVKYAIRDSLTICDLLD